MVASCSTTGETAGPCRCLAPQTCSVLDLVRTELQTLRLAITSWEKGASRVNDCQAIGGSVGEKDCPGLGG
jgi:hypothetical protein